MIVYWDIAELMSSDVISTNDYQVRKLAFNKTGDFLASICYDEMLKKWQLDIYGKNRQLVSSSMISNSNKTSIAWHPKNANLLAYAGEVEKREDAPYGGNQTNGNGQI